MVVEGIPQLLTLAMVMTHWHGDFDKAALSFFLSLADVPLCLFYLSFYCNQKTKYVVVGKLFFLALDKSFYHWADFIEKYIHLEEEIDKNSETVNDKIQEDFLPNYNSSNFGIVLGYQIVFVLLTPVKGKLKY